MAGQSAGLVCKIQPAAEIIREMFTQAAEMACQKILDQIPGLEKEHVALEVTKTC